MMCSGVSLCNKCHRVNPRIIQNINDDRVMPMTLTHFHFRAISNTNIGIHCQSLQAKLCKFTQVLYAAILFSIYTTHNQPVNTLVNLTFTEHHHQYNNMFKLQLIGNNISVFKSITLHYYQIHRSKQFLLINKQHERVYC